MNAEDYMLEELALQEHVINNIKNTLIEQNVERLLNYHLGTYELEEGEILEPLDPVELDKTAKKIAIEQYKQQLYSDIREPEEPEPDNQDYNNVYLFYGYDDEPIEIIIE